MILLSQKLDIKWWFKTSSLNNWMFQSANICLILSYATKNILILRSVLTLACLWFMLWGVTFPNGVLIDGVAWNYIMMLVNLKHAIELFYEKMPIQFPIYLENIYQHMFITTMDRKAFKKLTDISFLRLIEKGKQYIETGDQCSSLCILYKGEMKVIRKSLPGHRSMKEASQQNLNVARPSIQKQILEQLTQCNYKYKVNTNYCYLFVNFSHNLL